MNHGKQNKPAWKFGSALGSVNKNLAISLNDIGTVYHAKPKYEKNPATLARCLGRVTKMLLSFLALTACVCVSSELGTEWRCLSKILSCKISVGNFLWAGGQNYSCHSAQARSVLPEIRD